MTARKVTTRVHCVTSLALAWRLCVLSLLIWGLVTCGGSASQPPPPPPPTPDFSLAVSPTSQTLNGGSSASVSLSATAIDGFSSQISVKVSGFPAGVSVSPVSITLTPGTPLQITLSATANVAAATETVTLTGTSGSLSHTTQLNLSVTPLAGLPTRTRYLRTDATTEYYQWINQNWIIYHASSAHYFVTDPSSNQVIVIDAATEKKIASILVPGAFGIDDTPDHSLFYVGTLIGDVYTIDPVGMTVTQRYMASQIGPYGFYAYTALVLADGQVALVGGPSNPSVGQSDSVAIWNPTDNSITNYGENGPNPGLPFTGCSVFSGTIAGFTLSADRTQIVFGIGETLCEFNPSTGTGVAATGASLELVALYHIVVTPDGKYVILANNLMTAQPAVAEVFNAQTLVEVSEFNVLGNTSSASGFFVSPDSTTLYIPGDPETGIIYAYSLATQQLVGWVPNFFTEPISGGGANGPIDSPYFLATDGSGLFVGPMEEGIGFVDLSVLQAGPVGTQFENAYAKPLSPPTGPTTGGTATLWSDVAPVAPLKSIYFGSGQASDISTSPNDPYPFTGILASTPGGSIGPADVYVFTSDGGMQLLPEAFSYGPTILEVTPNMATAEGGGTGYIYGYGFGPLNATTIPSGLTVTVGGSAAPVTAFNGNAYNSAYPPFPLESIAYTVPPGTSGTSVNVDVTTSSGSTTAASALSYLPATQQFPLTGSSLAQGVYDPYTGLYYFTDTNQIQVFSRTQGKWLSPISIPAPAGTTQRLWGIALSPDGTKLAVSDANADAIYVLDPASPTSVKTFIVGPVSGFQNDPTGLAISDTGNVYFMVLVIGQGGGADQFFKLNTNTGAIFNYGINGPGLGANDAYLRNVISSDNSRVFSNELGYIFYIDTATDTPVHANIYLECCYLGSGNYDLALSSNQTQFEGTGYFYDFNLNAESFYTQNDREILNIAYVYGAKLSPDGRLFFQPSTNGIDVFDGNLGDLLDRISLPFALSPNYDALVDDGTDNVLVAIIGNGDGIAIVDLTSISEPPPLPYDRNRSRRTHGISGRHDRPGKPSVQQSQPLQPSHVVPHITRPILPYISQPK